MTITDEEYAQGIAEGWIRPTGPDAAVNESAPATEESPVILAAGTWPTNGHLIADVAALGYLDLDWTIWDPTYGHGSWWTRWQPTDGRLFRTDIDPAKSPDHPGGVDFVGLVTYEPGRWDAITLDPPYKLTGTDAGGGQRYGVHQRMPRDGRHALMATMLDRATTLVRPGGTILFRCQDQIEGGRARWQSHAYAQRGVDLGLELTDELLFSSYRPQPEGRTQQHARRNVSQLLVFTKPVRRRTPAMVLPPLPAADLHPTTTGAPT